MPSGEGCAFRIQPDEVSNGGAAASRTEDLTAMVDEPWHCPHETHEDADFCLFHLPIEERESRGITPGDVTSAFLHRVTDRGRDPKAFVGAHFRHLDLRYRTIDVDDRFPIDLRGAAIDTLQMNDAAIGQPVEATAITIGECSIEHATLRADWTLTDATFTGPVTLRESTFGSELYAEAAVFEDHFECVETRIDGEASFTDAQFFGPIDLQECEFHMDASFARVTFADVAVFDGAEFHGGANVLSDDADFTETTFAAEASFEQAQFRYGNFSDTAFEAVASFDGSVFASGCEFDEAEFAGSASFDRVSFEGDTNFESAAFTEAVSIQEALFDADAIFREVTFADSVTIAGCLFTGGSRLLQDDADFSNARFEADFDCQLTEFRYAEFDGCLFEGAVDFRRTEYERGASFRGIDFGGDVDFYRARFEGEVTFTETTFDGASRFDESVFADDASFADVEMAKEARFHGVEFRGGTKDVEDITFESATFGGDVDFDEADFRFACFEDARFEADGSFVDCTFEQGGSFDGSEASTLLSFRQSVFDGATSFADLTAGELAFADAVFNHDVVFDGSDIAAAVDFSGVQFTGGTVRVDDAGFADTSFDGPVDFSDAEFQYVNFTDATFAEDVTFTNAAFRDDAIFDGTVFEGQLTCYQTQFDERTSFEGVHTVGPATFDESIFDSDVTFSAFRSDAEVTFRGTEFHGGANDQIDDATFESAEFGGPTTFSSAQFRQGNFDSAAFEDTATFAGVRFRHGVSFAKTQLAEELDCTAATFSGAIYFEPEAREEYAVVDFSTATIETGRIVETGPVYYDLTETTIGDVRLEQTDPSINIFDRFLFLNTAFDGFDFSLHRDYLTQNEWRIHDVVFDGDVDIAAFDFEVEPDQLETTYLKARNSAQATGDNKAASEFFIREYEYRRNQYTEIIRSSGLTDPLASMRAGWRWFTNWFFDVTCGYGERPSKVVVASTAVVLLYGLIYWLLGIDVPGGGLTSLLVYSFQGFTSLVLGAPEGSTTIVNLVTATEGFSGAFFIALFVFSLTRSMNR